MEESRIRMLYETLETVWNAELGEWDWSAFETQEIKNIIQSLDAESLREFKMSLERIANSDVYPSCITAALASNPSEDACNLRRYLECEDPVVVQCAMQNPSTDRDDIDELYTPRQQEEILGMSFDIDYSKFI